MLESLLTTLQWVRLFPTQSLTSLHSLLLTPGIVSYHNCYNTIMVGLSNRSVKIFKSITTVEREETTRKIFSIFPPPPPLPSPHHRPLLSSQIFNRGRTLAGQLGSTIERGNMEVSCWISWVRTNINKHLWPDR